MPGKVYCFNAYNEPINQLTVNGLSAGTVSGWSVSPPNLYTPVSVIVPRALHGDGLNVPAFPNDMPTALRVDWDSYSIQAKIDLMPLHNVSLYDDLILYITLNQLTLMNTQGFVLITQSTSPGQFGAGPSILDDGAGPELPTTHLA
ncbi:hypothetical protein DMC25_24690 [Caulobacter sp. D4A]|uniref:hypothetical protein n=1 Tax=unclassified Caulobacter TaxID=2648921 RepID=UPI000D736015|nr:MULTISPECIES: hypothetical protein [unclassified Caulobacter]PXA75344.1 hypothetical protein DMC25_24690 [Caulobacter sp. D4A]PXA91262.1 hypothetical protein DMC18_13505 [Caulobacter sp. D5]